MAGKKNTGQGKKTGKKTADVYYENDPRLREKKRNRCRKNSIKRNYSDSRWSWSSSRSGSGRKD